MAKITSIFLDIGGVLLTNGWDHHERKRAAKHFDLNYADMDARPRLNYGTHEEGRLTFREYLDRIVFYTKRPLTRSISQLYVRAIKVVPKDDCVAGTSQGSISRVWNFGWRISMQTLIEIANSLVIGGKGLLAIDESIGTFNQRLAEFGIPKPVEVRRAYRELILTKPQLGGRISGVIVYGHCPWALSFSLGRALQQPALKIWHGDDKNAAAAQQEVAYRARCNSAARRGDYTSDMESK